MDLSYAAVRIASVLVCLVLHACLYVKGLSLSHEAAYNILMRIRISLQNRMEKLPLGGDSGERDGEHQTSVCR